MSRPAPRLLGVCFPCRRGLGLELEVLECSIAPVDQHGDRLSRTNWFFAVPLRASVRFVYSVRLGLARVVFRDGRRTPFYCHGPEGRDDGDSKHKETVL